MRALWLFLGLLIVTQPGCALWKRVKAAAFDPSDSHDKATGEYDYIGKNFRGPLERENDPTKRWLYSEKHLEIERNLGVGD